MRSSGGCSALFFHVPLDAYPLERTFCATLCSVLTVLSGSVRTSFFFSSHFVMWDMAFAQVAAYAVLDFAGHEKIGLAFTELAYSRRSLFLKAMEPTDSTVIGQL